MCTTATAKRRRKQCRLDKRHKPMFKVAKLTRKVGKGK